MLCREVDVLYQQQHHSQIQLFHLLSLCNKSMEYFFHNLFNIENVFTLLRKIFGIRFPTMPRNSCRSLFGIPCHYMFSFMNFIVNNQENFKQINLYTLLKQGMGTTSKHHMPIFLVFRKINLC
jgi:hypothetical protein